MLFIYHHAKTNSKISSVLWFHVPQPPGNDPDQTPEIPPMTPPDEGIELPPREEPFPFQEPEKPVRH